MATGDRNAPERHEAGRAGGTNPRSEEGDKRKQRKRKRSSRFGSLKELAIARFGARFIRN